MNKFMAGNGFNLSPFLAQSVAAIISIHGVRESEPRLAVSRAGFTIDALSCANGRLCGNFAGIDVTVAHGCSAAVSAAAAGIAEIHGRECFGTAATIRT